MSTLAVAVILAVVGAACAGRRATNLGALLETTASDAFVVKPAVLGGLAFAGSRGPLASVPPDAPPDASVDQPRVDPTPAQSNDLGLTESLFGTHDPFKEFSADPFGDVSRGGYRFSRQTFAQSSVMGPDGKVRTQRFASSDVGDREQGVREAHQAYSDSASDVVRTGIEQHLGDRAVKVSRDLDRETREERRSDAFFKGVPPAERTEFEKEFEGKAAEHLPRGGRQLVLERAVGRSDALPASAAAPPSSGAATPPSGDAPPSSVVAP